MLNHNLPINRFPNACPCCGYVTLDARGEYDICTVRWWEDDGQDNDDANVVRGGPNSNLSLTRARINFLPTGIFQPLRTDLRDKQQPVDSLVQQRFFTFEESTQTIAEPSLGWSTTIRELDDDQTQSLYRIGDHVRVVVNYRNKTPRTGIIDTAIWHHKLGIWHYRLVDDTGHSISKRYEAPDLIASSQTTGNNAVHGSRRGRVFRNQSFLAAAPLPPSVPSLMRLSGNRMRLMKKRQSRLQNYLT